MPQEGQSAFFAVYLWLLNTKKQFLKFHIENGIYTFPTGYYYLCKIQKEAWQMIRKYICIHMVNMLSCLAITHAQESYCFRIYLKDKGETHYFIEKPEEFLSAESIARRYTYSIPVSEEDLPISQSYINEFVKLGCTPIVTSKWMKTVVVSSPDEKAIRKLAELGMVDSVKWIWQGTHQYQPLYNRDESSASTPRDTMLPSLYGYAEKQIEMLNGKALHQAGFKGEGMRIAVIDAGFIHADRIAVFDSLRLIGTCNMVFPGQSVFIEDEHGTKSLSCLAACMPGIITGTAPKASYLLIKSEDSRSEYPIEEDYWVAAVEYADSVGVDVISSSLGYSSFDKEGLGYTPSQLDGESAFISKAAGRVADKGILLFNSCGNEGSNSWGRITFPADAHNIISVGAITEAGTRSSFSSGHHTADGRIKPDVVALGTNVAVINGNGSIEYANGTSFSTPIVAGLGVCLRQALPQLTSREIMELIRRSAHKYSEPDDGLGYGVPDFFNAYKEGMKHVESDK